jgi:hypothetical protein
MSRSSPTGFAFSILFEIAAVVVIVSFLPRVDLRPMASAAAGQDASQPGFNAGQSVDSPVSPVNWTTPSVSREPAGRETSYYERRRVQDVAPAATGSFPVQPAPPLIELEPQRTEFAQRPQYVEQRLDRASQQLVNSVGTAVVSAADNWLRPPPAANPTARPLPAAMTPVQPRPWIRY